MNAVLQYVRALAAAAGLSGILFGIPVLLALSIGDPLPEMDALQVGDLSTDVLIHLGATFAWFCWVYLILLLIAETRAQIVQQPPPPLPGLTPSTNLIRPLLAVLFAAPTIAATSTTAIAATATTAPPAHPMPPADTGATTAAPASATGATTGLTTARSTPQPGHLDHDAPPPIERLRSESIARTWSSSNPAGASTSDHHEEDHQAAADHQRALPASTTTSPSGQGETFLLGMGSGIGLSLIAATFYAVIGRRRRHQNAARRVGFLPAAVPAHVAVIERHLHESTDLAQTLLTWLDTALNDADAARVATGSTPLDVLAARIDLEQVSIVLAEPSPHPPPHPWRPDPATGRWTLALEDAHPYLDRNGNQGQDIDHGTTPDTESVSASASHRRWVWIGSDPRPATHDVADGLGRDAWLLNLAMAPRIRVIGAAPAATQLVRAMALSLQRRNDDPRNMLQVDSSAPELAELRSLLQTAAPGDQHAPSADTQPDRHAPQLAAADDKPGGLPSILHVIDRIHPPGPATPVERRPAASVLVLTDDLASARADEVRLVLDTTGQLHTSFTTAPITFAHLSDQQIDHVRPVLDSAHAPADRRPGPMPAAAALHGDSAPRMSVIGTPIPPGHTSPLLAPDADLPPQAATQPHHTTERRSPYANAPDDVDPRTPNVRHDRSDRPDRPAWDAGATFAEPARDRDGAANTGSGPVPPADPREAPLPITDPTKTDRYGRDDLLAVAPTITPAQQPISDTDPDLDSDLDLWHSENCPYPRLRVLGPVKVRANGVLPTRGQRIPWWTEVVVLLYAHPEGLTYDQLAELLWPEDATNKAAGSMPRQAISAVRRWLGTDPDTGQLYVPEGRPGGWQRSPHRIDHLLTDADLARRLAMRGNTRGPAGLDDLQAALDLVTGPILDGRRRNGYAWLPQTPLLADLTGMITDTAHTLAGHWLSQGRPDLAENVSRTAIMAGSRNDITYLDLIAAAGTAQHHGVADWWLKQLIAIHDGDVEEDLPPWTLARLQQIRRRGRTAVS